MLSIDWTAVSVFVAVLVFLSERGHKRRSRMATSLVVAEFLAWDFLRISREARELGMHLASGFGPRQWTESREDPYLSKGAAQLAIPSLERHASDLSSLPPGLIEASARCMAGIRDLQEAISLLTSDLPVGRSYREVSEARRGVTQAAAALMNEALSALEIARSARSAPPNTFSRLFLPQG
jgi:hypothetical protein